MASNQFHMIELTRSAVCFTAANKIRFPPEKFQVRIHTFQMKSQDRLAGHVVCIFHSQCLSMCSIESCAWENEQVREKNQQQTKKNRFKATFKDIGITANREALALDRPSWRIILTKRGHAVKIRRYKSAEQKSAACKAKVSISANTLPSQNFFLSFKS